jgi:hypothetical protein
MTGTIIKTIERADGQRRILIIQRSDGNFGFIEELRVHSLKDQERWTKLFSHSTICETADIAEREARGAIDWLS